LNKLQNIFISIVNKVESNNTPFRRYIFLFFAILVLRLALEFFSSSRLFTFFDVMHIGLWFIFIVMAFLIQLHLFSGEDLIKVAKLVITCFTIALTAPIIDILVSGGQNSKMNYLSINSAGDIFWAYITVGGSSLTRGATLGIRIEIILLVIACFNYVYTKRNSIGRGLLASICIYTILFLSGAIPYFLGKIVSSFQLQYGPDDQSTLLLLLTLDLFLLFIFVWRKTGTRFWQLLKQAPWGSILNVVPLFFAGAILAIHNYPDNWKLDPTTLFWFPLLLVIAFCFIVFLSLKIKNTTGGKFYWENGILFILLLTGSLISARTFFSTTLIWGLLFLLYESPLTLVKIPFLNSLLKAMAALAVAFLGFTTFGAPMIGFPSKWILGVLSIGLVEGTILNYIKPEKRQWVALTFLPLSIVLLFMI
jgi:hypothetical protein